MNAKTYIFCHDTDIVKQCEAEGRFKDFAPYTWVMLGFKDFDGMAGLDHIVARYQPDNIENHRNLVAWTGWYALAKNGYIKKGDVVNLFEYDITRNGDFDQRAYCSYFRIPVDVYPYWTCGNNFEPHIKQLTGRGAKEFYQPVVPVTSNYTLTWDDSYLDLTIACIEQDLVAISYVGHILERAYSQRFADITYNVGAFKHAFANSHGF